MTSVSEKRLRELMAAYVHLSYAYEALCNAEVAAYSGREPVVSETIRTILEEVDVLRKAVLTAETGEGKE